MRHQAHQWTLDGDQWSFHYSNRAAAVQSPSTSFSQTSFSPATISPLKSYVGNSFNPNDKTTNKTPYHSALRSHAGNSWKPSNTKTDPISTTPVLGSCAGNSWVSTRDRPKPKCSILAPERQSCNAPIPLFQQETLHQIREQTASSTPALSGTTNDYPKTCPSSTSLSSNALSRWAQYVDVDDIEVLPCSPSNQTTSSRADTILSPSTTVSSNSSFSTSSIESSRSFHSTESSSSLWASRQLLGRKPNQGASFQLSSLQRQNGTTEARNESAAYPTLTDCKSEASSKQKHTTGPSRHPRRSQASESFQPPSLFREFKSPRGLLVQQLVDATYHLVTLIWPESDAMKAFRTPVIHLRHFICETLKRSRTSYSTLQLTLWYLVLIKPSATEARTWLQQDDTSILFRALPGPSSHEDCYRRPSSCNTDSKFATKETPQLDVPNRSLCCGRRMFLAALILASKFLQDRNFTAKAWSKITGLARCDIVKNERCFLQKIKWNLHLGERDFNCWSRIITQCTESRQGGSSIKDFWYCATDWLNHGLDVEGTRRMLDLQFSHQPFCKESSKDVDWSAIPHLRALSSTAGILSAKNAASVDDLDSDTSLKSSEEGQGTCPRKPLSLDSTDWHPLPPRAAANVPQPQVLPPTDLVPVVSESQASQPNGQAICHTLTNAFSVPSTYKEKKPRRPVCAAATLYGPPKPVGADNWDIVKDEFPMMMAASPVPLEPAACVAQHSSAVSVPASPGTAVPNYAFGIVTPSATPVPSNPDIATAEPVTTVDDDDASVSDTESDVAESPQLPGYFVGLMPSDEYETSHAKSPTLADVPPKPIIIRERGLASLCPRRARSVREKFFKKQFRSPSSALSTIRRTSVGDLSHDRSIKPLSQTDLDQSNSCSAVACSSRTGIYACTPVVSTEPPDSVAKSAKTLIDKSLEAATAATLKATGNDAGKPVPRDEVHGCLEHILHPPLLSYHAGSAHRLATEDTTMWSVSKKEGHAPTVGDSLCSSALEVGVPSSGPSGTHNDRASQVIEDSVTNSTLRTCSMNDMTMGPSSTDQRELHSADANPNPETIATTEHCAAKAKSRKPTPNRSLDLATEDTLDEKSVGDDDVCSVISKRAIASIELADIASAIPKHACNKPSTWDTPEYRNTTAHQAVGSDADTVSSPVSGEDNDFGYSKCQWVPDNTPYEEGEGYPPYRAGATESPHTERRKCFKRKPSKHNLSDMQQKSRRKGKANHQKAHTHGSQKTQKYPSKQKTRPR